MKLSEKLLIVANWLECSENDLIVRAEEDDCLEIVAAAMVKAAEALKDAADEVVEVEPTINAESLDEIAAIAKAFDESGDQLLKKEASVLDELLLTIASPRGAAIQFCDSQDDRIEELKKKYKQIKEKHDEMNKVSEDVKKIEESPAYKKYRPLQHELNTRYCPIHFGSPVVRVGEHTVQCVLCRQVFNYENGFNLPSGHVPGSCVENQTKVMQQPGETTFNTRSSRLGLDSGENSQKS